MAPPSSDCLVRIFRVDDRSIFALTDDDEKNIAASRRYLLFIYCYKWRAAVFQGEQSVDIE